ncbi:MAG: TIGR02281 family clan AA aspartic protease [Granulosicoccaceae bacterium]|jgi:aspartyl protease family protein
MHGPVLALCILATSFAEATDIVVNGLFSNKAVVTIDGKQRVLKVGKVTPEGVKLLSADSRSALIEVDGRQKRFTLGGHIGGSFTRDDQPAVTIYRNQHNMFTAVGSINNFPVTFLVDTGASQVAMSTKDARRFGVNYQLKGKRTWVNTAAGTKTAWAVKLNKVKVGEIELRNVDGMVVDGAGPGGVLLGMSFLGRLEMNNDGQAMVLKKKF